MLELELEKQIEDIKRVKVSEREEDCEDIGVLELEKKRFEFKSLGSKVQFCDVSLKEGKLDDLKSLIERAL